jgi:uncharacterized repeat protein (TIGR02543 family)
MSSSFLKILSRANVARLTVAAILLGSLQVVAIVLPTVSSALPASGSIYLNNASIYTTFDSAIDIDTGQFTMEMWVKPTAAGGMGLYSGNQNGGQLGYTDSDCTGNSAQFFTGVWGEWCNGNKGATGVIPSLNSWSHIVMLRDANNYESIYLNGSRIIYQSGPNRLGMLDGQILAKFMIGAVQRQNFTGYISNFRLVTGAALYSGATLTVPTSELTTTVASGTVQLLMSATSSASMLTDSVSNRVFTTAATKTANPSFTSGTYSYSASSPFTAALPGSVAFTRTASPNNQLLKATVAAPATDSVTYEWWFKYTSANSNLGDMGMLETRSNNGVNCDGFDVSIGYGKLRWGNCNWISDGAISFTANQWNHIALVRDGSTNWVLYLNGQSAVTYSTSFNTTSTFLQIGQKSGTGETFNGNISNFRYVKGVAVYTGNFTVPNLDLTSTQSSGTNISAITGSQTQLLLNMRLSEIVDNSSYLLSLSSNGVITSSSDSPFSVANKVVTFKANGGIGSDITQSSNVSASLTANSFSRVGYTFSGWATSSGGAVAYANSASFPFTADQTLYAIWTANTYTVTYNYNSATSGNATTSSTYTTGSTAITLPQPGKTGYTFANWYSDAGLSSLVGAGGGSYSPTGATLALTAYAKWTADPHHVTYNLNGGDGTVPTQVDVVSAGTFTTAATPTKSNYTFSGWSNGVTNTAASTLYTMGVTDLTLTAQWTANTYTVTYNYNGATSGNATASSTYTTGLTAITLPQPEKTGYTFVDWNSDAGLSASIGAGGGSYSPAGATLALTAYAKWAANTYTITYKPGSNGSGSDLTQTFTYGVAATLKDSSAAITRVGYSISGWTTTDAASLTNALSSSYSSASNLVVYPVWSANSYSVTYKHGANGLGNDISENFTFGNSITLKDATAAITRDGYSISGWSTTDGSVQTNALSSTYTSAGNLVLYPIWNPNPHHITYNLDGGDSALPTQADVVTAGTFTTAAAPTKSNYTFNGWSNGATSTSAGASYTMGTTDLTLTALWVAAFQITFDSSGTAVTSILFTGSAVSQPTNPTRTGYVFSKWKDSLGNEISWPYSPASPVTLTANWTALTYSITFHDTNSASGAGSDGGTAAVAQSGSGVGSVTLSANTLSLVGYAFAGWATSNGSISVVYLDEATVSIASNVTLDLYPVWTIKSYSVTYLAGVHGTLTGTNSQSINHGSNATQITAVPELHFHFTSWSDGSTSNPRTDTNIVSALNLTASFAIDTFTITYKPNGGTVDTATVTVDYNGVVNHSTATWTGYHFDGWFDAQTGGNLVAAGFSATVNRDIWAHWTQLSLYGIPNLDLNRYGFITSSTSYEQTIIARLNGNTSSTINVPANAFSSDTRVEVYTLPDHSLAQAKVSPNDSYIISQVVAWHQIDDNSVKTAAHPIEMIIVSPLIKKGAVVYSVLGDEVTVLGRARVDGTVTVLLTTDPAVIVAMVKPDAPTAVTASNGADTTSLVSWSAPIYDGGSAITGYSVTSSPSVTAPAACTNVNVTSCTFTGLTNGTSYTFQVVAINAIGTSETSTTSAPITPLAPAPAPAPAPSGGGGGGSVYVAPTPDPAIALAEAAKKKAEAEKAELEAKAAAELKAAQDRAAAEAAQAAALKAAQEIADAQAKAAAELKAAQDKAAEDARIAEELRMAQEKAEADLRAAAEKKAAEDAATALALANKKITPAVTLYSLSSNLKLSKYDSAYLKKFVSKLQPKAKVTCVGYIYTKNTTYAKAKALATNQAKAVCAMMKLQKKTIVTSIAVYPSKKAPKAAVGARWVAVNYRIDGFKS